MKINNKSDGENESQENGRKILMKRGQMKRSGGHCPRWGPTPEGSALLAAESGNKAAAMQQKSSAPIKIHLEILGRFLGDSLRFFEILGRFFGIIGRFFEIL